MPATSDGCTGSASTPSASRRCAAGFSSGRTDETARGRGSGSLRHAQDVNSPHVQVPPLGTFASPCTEVVSARHGGSVPCTASVRRVSEEGLVSMLQEWRSRILVLCIGISLVCPGTPQGQVTTATVYGNVADGSGAQIPGAPVVIVNEETGAVQNATTSTTGEFTFNFLPVGRYTLTITRQRLQGTDRVRHRAHCRPESSPHLRARDWRAHRKSHRDGGNAAGQHGQRASS